MPSDSDSVKEVSESYSVPWEEEIFAISPCEHAPKSLLKTRTGDFLVENGPYYLASEVIVLLKTIGFHIQIKQSICLCIHSKMSQ